MTMGDDNKIWENPAHRISSINCVWAVGFSLSVASNVDELSSLYMQEKRSKQKHR